MALSTHSVFYYGYEITKNNNKINFKEGVPELTATITNGSYSLTDLLVAIKTALDAAGALTYTVSVDRDTRKITIASTSTFSLLTNTGSQVGLSPWSLLGFSQTSDHTGASTYTGESSSGSVYYPQFVLQGYEDPENNQEAVDPSVNQSSNGKTEAISFGLKKFVTFDIKWINEYPQDGKLIKTDSNALDNLRNFLLALVDKQPVEFMPDEDDRATFITGIGESIGGNKKGIGFAIKELVDRDLPGYYEINDIKLRVME
jgi:hypothetical protein